MTIPRVLASLALAALLLQPAAAIGQEPTTAPPSPAGTAAASDPRLAALEAIFPSDLAGLSLERNLQLATGDELVTVMTPEESDLLADLLAATDRTLADYAAASSYLLAGELPSLVIQAHRIAGVDADTTTGAWLGILSQHLHSPQTDERLIDGRTVTVLSDAWAPDALPLYLYPDGEVTWMVWAADDATVETLMLEVAAGSALPPAG